MVPKSSRGLICVMLLWEEVLNPLCHYAYVSWWVPVAGSIKKLTPSHAMLSYSLPMSSPPLG